MTTAVTLTAGRIAHAAPLAATVYADDAADAFDLGAGVATIDLSDSPAAAVLSFSLPNPAWSAGTAANPSVITLQGVPISAVASGDATALDLAIGYDRDGVEVGRCSVGATGSGQGVEVDNVIVATGQTRRITGGTWSFTLS